MNTLLARFPGWTFFLLAVFAVAACGGGGGGTASEEGAHGEEGDLDADTTAPALLSALPSDTTIGPNTFISVIFSETMDRNSLQVGGDLAAEAETDIWFDGNMLDDATTVRPLTTWSGGSGRTLTFDATDLAGNPVPTVTLTFDVDATPPVGALVEPFDGILTVTQPIVIEFNEPMDEFVNPGGFLGDDSDGGTYELVGGERLRLRFEPNTEWLRGRGRSLRVRAADEYGNDVELEYEFHVVDGVIHVSTAGNDSNSGTADQPLRTIPQAIDRAISSGFTGSGNAAAAIRIAEGLYTVDSGSGDPIMLGETEGEAGISLYGGYNASFTSRDPATRASVLEDTSTAAGVRIASLTEFPNRAIHADTWADERTVIDGMTIRGSSQGGHSAAVFVSGGLIDLRNCVIAGGGSDGGNQPADWAFGVYDYISNGLTLVNNTINGGVAGDTAAIFNFAGKRAQIDSNRIDGGGSTAPNSRSIGVFMYATRSGIIRNNVIEGGKASTAAGIYVQEVGESTTDPVIRNNTVNASGAFNSRGIYLWGPTTPVIDNNIISASTGSSRQYCIDENNVDADPASLRNNVLFDCATALYRDELTTDITTISDVNNLANTDSSGNISIDPMFVDRDGADNDLTTFADNDWRLSAGTPVSVSEGGLDLSAEFELDLEGKARTVPWSIGAYERD